MNFISCDPPTPNKYKCNKQNKKQQQNNRKSFSNFYCTIYHYFCFVKLATVLDIRNLLTNLHNDVLCIHGRKQSLQSVPLNCSLLFTLKCPGHWHTLT